MRYPWPNHVEAPEGDGLGLHDCLGIGIGGPARHRRPWGRRLGRGSYAGEGMQSLGILAGKGRLEPGDLVDPPLEGEFATQAPVARRAARQFGPNLRLGIAVEKNVKCGIVPRKQDLAPCPQAKLRGSLELLFAHLKNEVATGFPIRLASDAQPKGVRPVKRGLRCCHAPRPTCRSRTRRRGCGHQAGLRKPYRQPAAGKHFASLLKRIRFSGPGKVVSYHAFDFARTVIAGGIR